MLDLDKEYGGFRKYLRSFPSYEALAEDLKKQFRFLGDWGVYAFLWVVGEKVPTWDEWNANRPPARPRISRTRSTHSISVG
jgi:3-methyladenine DNA glycosylase Tag